jgi:hypothetical protein
MQPSAIASSTARTRVEAQGFVGLDDRSLAQINLWLRLAPAICLVWTAVGTAMASAPILWTLVPLAALGAILPGSPFDLIYTFGFRRMVNGPKLPPYPMPRRFACIIATAMLAGAAWGFQTGNLTLGYTLGLFVMAASLTNVATGFCLGSFFYGLIFGRPAACGPK